MTTVRTISDKGAVIAWSPVKEFSDFLAVGTKEGGGGGFEDYGGDLSIYSAELASAVTECRHVCSVKTSSRFLSLAWTGYTPKVTDAGSPAGNAGLVAGGMADGTIIVWDVGKLLAGDGEQAMLAVIERSSGQVRALQFNPHGQSRHLLAAGSADGHVLVIDLTNPTAPTVASPLSGGARLDHEVTAVAWNTAVPHILATATLGGVVAVWDLKENRPWCTLKDPHRAPIADVVWHPEDGLFLATACDDDARPVLRVWDLRSSTNVPLAELAGHTKGVVSLDWCPADSSLLLSCGKDGHTFLWDVGQGRAVADIPAGSGPGNSAPSTMRPQGAPADGFGPSGGQGGASSVFGAPPGTDASGVFGSTLGGMGGIGASAGRRYMVRWSRKCPAYFAACSFDRRVTIHSAAAWGPDLAPRIPAPYGAAPEPNIRRAPRWLKRHVGATFGFGGKLVTFAAPPSATQSVSLRIPGDPYMKIVQVCKTSIDLGFTSTAANFASLWTRLMSGDFDLNALCTFLGSQAVGAGDELASIWQLLAAVSSPEPRQALLTYLGYNAANVSADLGHYAATHSSMVGGAVVEPPRPLPQQVQRVEHAYEAQLAQAPGPDASEVFGAASSNGSAEDFFSGGFTAPIGGTGLRDGHDFQQEPEVEGAENGAGATLASFGLTHDNTDYSQSLPEASFGSEPAPKHRHGERTVVVRGAEEDDEVLRRALVVGDFASAVSVCMTQGRLDDALLLASVGAPDLWERTKEEFFARKAAQARVEGRARVMAAVVPHVLKGSLADMVASSALFSWRETLALSCTYAKAEEFPSLARALGDRLVSEAADRAAATVCYMASPAPEAAVDLLVHRMQEQSRLQGRQIALISFAQVAMVFRNVAAAGPVDVQSASDVQAEAPFLAELATLLADEGDLTTAALFAARIGPTAPVGSDGLNIGDVVRDRLLRAFDRHEYATQSAAAIQSQPFPYTLHEVNACTGFIQLTQRPAALATTPAAALAAVRMAGPVMPAASAADIFGSHPGASADSSFSAMSQVQSGYAEPALAYSQPAYAPQQAYGQPMQTAFGQQMQALQPAYGQQAMQAAPQQQGYGHPAQVTGAPHGYLPQQQAPATTGAGYPQRPQQAGPTGYGAAPTVPAPTRPVVAAQPVGWQPQAAPAPAPYGMAGPGAYGGAGHHAVPPPAPPFVPAAPQGVPVPQEFFAGLDAIRSLIPMLHSSVPLNAVEKKQLEEAAASLDIVASKASSGGLKPDIVNKLTELSAAMGSYDFKRGAKLQSELATMEWAQTKEWIKGVRNLVTLCLTKSGPGSAPR